MLNFDAGLITLIFYKIQFKDKEPMKEDYRRIYGSNNTLDVIYTGKIFTLELCCMYITARVLMKILYEQLANGKVKMLH